MESQPIDDLNFIQPNSQKNDPVVKVVTIAICTIFLIFSFICFRDIFDLIRDYFSYRHKFVVYFDIRSFVAAFSISSIPLTAYLASRKRFYKQGFISYLILLSISLILFVGIFVLGIEVIFSFSVSRFVGNALTPSYILYPPIPAFCFNLLFVLDALLIFMLFQMISWKRRNKR